VAPADVPARRISRESLERVIRRAAELQAEEMDSGEGLTEQEILKLGDEVGIDGRFLRQALYEERAGAAVTGESGLLAKWIGPGRVAASRVVPGDRLQVEQALEQWMTESEALTVKRRLPEGTVWERQKGFFADMKRGFGVGGRSYELAKAHDVTVSATQLESGFCHVEMVADIRDTRAGAAAGGGIAAGVLGAAGLAILAIPAASVGPTWPVALVPLAAAGLSPLLVGRAFRRRAERVQLALEQVLDRLERGEIRPKHMYTGPRASAFVRIADEIRRAITEVSEAGRQPPRGLPPSGAR
jgi:hypothetical protein